MKDEAPEKIYLHIRANNEIGSTWHGNKITNNDIGYTITDVFIEKARKWFEMQNEGVDSDGNYNCDMTDFEDFRKYMKGE